MARTVKTTPIGTLTRKMPRHDQSLMMIPPRIGPTIAPRGKMLENMPSARLRSSPKASATIPLADGMNAAPPKACTTRSAISMAMLLASPHNSEAMVKTTAATTKTRFRPS
jgi:hypothetical protein